MKRFISLLAFCILLFSCSEEDTIKPGEKYLNGDGTIIVTVLSNGKPVSQINGNGITVVTVPSTYALETDVFGQVEFRNIASGSFDVYASKFWEWSGKTSGKTSVKLNDDVQHIEINLDNKVSLYPGGRIYWSGGLNHAMGEEIVFKANVTSKTCKTEDLKFVWESDLDGIIEGENVLTDNDLSFTTSNLSVGYHRIKLSVTNLLGFTSIDITFIKINNSNNNTLNH